MKLAVLAAVAGVVTVAPPGLSPSLPSALATGTGFTGVTPARLLDTRDGTGAPAGAVGPGGSIDVQITGRGGIPEAGVSAVVLNVTAVTPTASSYVTVWPTGAPRPTASNLNFVAAQTVPNLVIAKVGVGGRVSLFNSAGATHLIADVSGYYADGSQLVPTVPTRLLDTRSGTGGVTGPTTTATNVQVIGQAGVPVGTTSVVLNVTVTEPSGAGYLTVWPTGFSQPNASNLNYVTGQTVPNLVITKIGNEGKITYSASASRVHVIIDVLGYTGGPTPMTESLDSVAVSSPCCNGDFNEGSVPVQGRTRANSVFLDGSACSIGTPSWTEYNLGRSWSTLATTLSFDDTRAPVTSAARFRILGDGVVLLEKNVVFGQSFDVTANVTNVLRLRLEVLNTSAVVGGTTPCARVPVFAEVLLLSTPGAPFPAQPEFFPLQPKRILDTRDGTGAAKGRVGADGTVELQVLGQGGVPTSGVGAVVMNVTVTEPDIGGYLTVWPTGVARPVASNLNFTAGQSVPNLVIVPVGAAGRVSLYNFVGFTHVIADVLGWFPGAVSIAPNSVAMAEALNSVFISSPCCNGDFNEGPVPAQGQTRLKSIFLDGSACSTSTSTWTEYDLGRQWKSLTTTLTFHDTLSPATSKVRFRLYGDGALLVEKTVAFGQAVDVSANVTNVLRLRLEVLNASVPVGGSTPCSRYAAFVTPTLTR